MIRSPVLENQIKENSLRILTSSVLEKSFTIDCHSIRQGSSVQQPPVEYISNKQILIVCLTAYEHGSIE